jgi:hypothetical protein
MILLVPDAQDDLKKKKVGYKEQEKQREKELASARNERHAFCALLAVALCL